MTSITFMTLLASVTGLLLSIGASCAVALLWLQYRSTSSARLSSRLTDLESIIEELSGQIKAVRAARNMAAYRARRQSNGFSEDQPSTATDPKEEQRREGDRILAQRALGRI